jgi:N-acetylglucosamine kinase-like BadF-type ATPase
MSGVDRPADKEEVTKWVRPLLPTAKLFINSDAIIGLASGTGGKEDGVVVISGTGMIAMSIRANHTVRAGGWG